MNYSPLPSGRCRFELSESSSTNDLFLDVSVVVDVGTNTPSTEVYVVASVTSVTSGMESKVYPFDVMAGVMGAESSIVEFGIVVSTQKRQSSLVTTCVPSYSPSSSSTVVGVPDRGSADSSTSLLANRSTSVSSS